MISMCECMPHDPRSTTVNSKSTPLCISEDATKMVKFKLYTYIKSFCLLYRSHSTLIVFDFRAKMWYIKGPPKKKRERQENTKTTTSKDKRSAVASKKYCGKMVFYLCDALNCFYTIRSHALLWALNLYTLIFHFSFFIFHFIFRYKQCRLLFKQFTTIPFQFHSNFSFIVSYLQNAIGSFSSLKFSTMFNTEFKLRKKADLSISAQRPLSNSTQKCYDFLFLFILNFNWLKMQRPSLNTKNALRILIVVPFQWNRI